MLRAASTPPIFTAPVSPDATASRFSRVATWWITIVYWLRSSSASANTKGSSCRAELLRASTRTRSPPGPAR